jgi:hypothetical protein
MNVGQGVEGFAVCGSLDDPDVAGPHLARLCSIIYVQGNMQQA